MPSSFASLSAGWDACFWKRQCCKTMLVLYRPPSCTKSLKQQVKLSPGLQFYKARDSTECVIKLVLQEIRARELSLFVRHIATLLQHSARNQSSTDIPMFHLRREILYKYWCREDMVKSARPNTYINGWLRGCLSLSRASSLNDCIPCPLRKFHDFIVTYTTPLSAMR